MTQDFSKNILFTEMSSIQNICSSLGIFGIKGFIYMRIYNDGTFIDFATHANWSELFLKNLFLLEYSEFDIKDHIYTSKGVSLWELNKSNKVWQEANEIYSIGNGISIVIPNNGLFTEVYCYYSDNKNYKINEFYLSNTELLRNFLFFFKERAHKLIEKSIENRLIIPTHYKDHFIEKSLEPDAKKKKEQFYTALNIKKFHVSHNGYLTYKEAECLSWLTKGKTSDEIGIILGVSRRTIEKHIDNMKYKLNCYNKATLISVSIKLGIIDFFNEHSFHNSPATNNLI